MFEMNDAKDITMLKMMIKW